MDKDYVILVDDNDRQTGISEKLLAHEKGLMHRAFSIFLFNSKGEFLLQQRANEKYHTGGLWSNTCCSHPRPDEDMDDALQRKLFQEMGIHCPLRKAFQFSYQTRLDNNLIENELDHIYVGEFSDEPNPNSNEVQNWKYSSFEDIKAEIAKNEEKFTPWFKLLTDRVMNHYESGITT